MFVEPITISGAIANGEVESLDRAAWRRAEERADERSDEPSEAAIAAPAAEAKTQPTTREARQRADRDAPTQQAHKQQAEQVQSRQSDSQQSDVAPVEPEASDDSDGDELQPKLTKSTDGVELQTAKAKATKLDAAKLEAAKVQPTLDGPAPEPDGDEAKTKAPEIANDEVDTQPAQQDAKLDRRSAGKAAEGPAEQRRVEAAPTQANAGDTGGGSEDGEQSPPPKLAEMSANDEPALELPRAKTNGANPTANTMSVGAATAGPSAAAAAAVDGASATQLAALEARASAIVEAPSAVTLTAEELGGDIDVRLRRIASGLHVHLEPSRLDQATKLAGSLTMIRSMLGRRGLETGRVSIGRERAEATADTDHLVERVNAEQTNRGGDQ